MRRRRTSCAFSLALFFLATPVATSAGAELGPPSRPEEATSGSFLIRSERALRSAPLLETRVEIVVTGMVARASVTQSFENPTDQWVEGIYVFPLPEGAAVDALHMIVGDREIEGVIQKKEEARWTYQKAAQEGRRASLVEQERPNLFTTKVANLGPHETLSIRIEYQEELDYEAGRFSLRFPTVVAPRFVPGSHGVAGFEGTGWGQNTDEVPDAARITPPVRAPGDPGSNFVVIEVRIQAGLPLSRVESPSHTITTEFGPDGEARVEFAEGGAKANADFVLEWEPEAGTAPAAALFSEQFEGDTYALLMLMPPAETASLVAALPREAIFVIDVSGSMHGESIAQARAALTLAIDRLGPGDRFNVIRFASDANALFPSSVPATPFAREQARKWVSGLEANGGTNMLGALSLALADPYGSSDGERLVRQVVFITDGAVGNERALLDNVKRTLGRSRLFAVGIGSAPNSFLMRKLSRFGRGTATWIGSPAEVGTKMSALFAKLESPALGEIQVHFPTSGVEAWPERVPDLYQSEPILVVARAPRLGGDLRIEGERGRVPFRVDLPFQGGGSESGLHKLWARRKVAALMDSLHEPGTDAERVREAVANLGLRHHLVTKHTSLVAVERVPVAPRGTPLHERNVPTELPRGWSHPHAFGPEGEAPMLLRKVRRVATSQGGALAAHEMPQTATPAALLLLLGAGAWLVAGVVRFTAWPKR